VRLLVAHHKAAIDIAKLRTSKVLKVNQFPVNKTESKLLNFVVFSYWRYAYKMGINNSTNI